MLRTWTSIYIYIYVYNLPCFWCWFGCLLHLTTRLVWSGQLMSAHSAAVRCNFEHLSVAMLHAKKNHLLDDEELMRLDTCRELHGRSSPRFIDLAPFQGSGSGRGWFCMHGFLGRIRQCSSSISDTQIFIYRYPDLLFNEFFSCTLALIVSALPQSCSVNVTPINQHF